MLSRNILKSTLRTRTMASYIPKNRLEGKVAVVTASTDGIGFAIARRLAHEGAKVVISSRKQKNVDCAVNDLRDQKLDVAGIVCHVGKVEDRKQLMECAKQTFGGIDILVSNAAVNPTVGGVFDCDESAWDKIFDINLKSSFLIAKEALPYIRKRGGGSIVFVSSIAGFRQIAVTVKQERHNLFGAYSVSKTAIFGLTKAAALQLSTEGINVNCIAPGIIETKFSQLLTGSEAARDAALSEIPMRRFGQVEDIAGVAAFLVSDDAKYITGETIVSAGGMISRL